MAKNSPDLAVVAKRPRGRPKKKSRCVRDDWPRVYRVLVRGEERWMVDARSAAVPNGRRTYHADEAEALAVAKQLDRVRANEGARAFFDLSAQERSEASEAFDVLLSEHPEASLVDAARYYSAHLTERNSHRNAPLVGKALEEFLAEKKLLFERGELSRLGWKDLRNKLNSVRRDLGELRLNELTEGKVHNFLDGLGLAARGRHNVKARLSQFLSWCVKRKWITSNPVAEIKIKLPRREPEALSVDQAEKLLRVVEQSEHAQVLVPYLCVSLFAGLRPGEGMQLDWSRIHLETHQIEVLAETSKIGERRFVEIAPNLAEWLLAYRQPAGPIIGSSFDRAWRQVRRAAGYKLPKDVLRHCFGTYWLAVHKNRAHLAELMGNSPKIIGQYYRRAIHPAHAQRYWQIVPTSGAQILPFPQATAQG